MLRRSPTAHPSRRDLLAGLAGALCLGPPALARAEGPGEIGAAVAEVAWSILARPHSVTLPRRDCSGMVCGILEEVSGVPVEGNTRSLWYDARAQRRTHTRRRPSPGDLSFFDHTVPRDGRSRLVCELTHIAVVLETSASGAIHLVHFTHGQARFLNMDLGHPHDHRVGGRTANDWLADPDAPPHDCLRLAGELWRGFASPEVWVSQVVASSVPEKVWDSPSELEARVLAGQAIPFDELGQQSCETLWALRNTAYARHGYDFETERARAWFAQRSWYHRVPGRRGASVEAHLSRADLQLVRDCLLLEELGGCEPLPLG